MSAMFYKKYRAAISDDFLNRELLTELPVELTIVENKVILGLVGEGRQKHLNVSFEK
jgi:hypothetical protein